MARSIYEALLDDQDDWASYEGFVKCSQTLSVEDDALRRLDASGGTEAEAPRASISFVVTGRRDALQERILRYIETHASSPSLFDDLETSLRRVQSLPLTVEGSPQKRASLLCMRRFLSDDVPVDQCLSIIKGDDTSASSDAACVLACTLQDAGNSVDACRILYSAHARDEGNARVTLAFVDALQSIGAGEAALRTYVSLGVKQIQLDSLGHLITPWAARLVAFLGRSVF